MTKARTLADNFAADINQVNVTTPLTGGGTSGTVTVSIQAGTTAQSGAVQLTDSTASTSVTTAATPNSVKAAYDLADGAIAKTIVDAKGDLITATAADTPSRLAVGSNGDTLVADSAATTGLRWASTPSASNPILNSAMDIWQRGTSLAVTSGSLTFYSADRWGAYRNATGSTISRQVTNDTTNLPFIQYAARVQRDSGNSSTAQISFFQSIESTNSIPFAGKTVTLSFYARAGANYSPTSSAMAATLYTGTGTDQNVINGFTGSSAVISQTATLTTTWQRFSYSATLASTATQIGMTFQMTPTGTASTNDWFEITGVQIDIGSVALPFRRNSISLQGELAACQRYYVRPANATAYANYGSGMGASTTIAQILVNLPVPMRVAPTSLEYSTLAVNDSVNVTALTNLTQNHATNCAVQLVATVASGLTQYRAYHLSNNNSTSGYLGLSAEL